uniref:Hydrocephalus-inducing protein-like n=1 Tax=Cyanistes caeruleus TaxID=156563 RepID=A0A8C0Z9K6_CYACU
MPLKGSRPLFSSAMGMALNDYSHELVCITKTERIVVPIRAIAARAILTIPDQLNFSECPVKSSTKKTLLLRNTGNLEAHYYISTQSPFSVVPAMGALGAGDSVQVTVGFHPLTTGAHFGSMVVCYNTGEIHTNLQGEAVDVSIGLRTYSVELKKTFITTSSHTAMFIENRSNIRAQFQWKTFPSEEDENEEKRRLACVDNTTGERRRAKKKGSCEDRRAILKSSVREKMMMVKEDPMLFSNDAFSLEPLEGEIGPNSSVQIKVTFKPLKAREYRSVAYCNISGRGSRLPLHLRGEGQGPVVEFSRQMLKLGNIFVNTSHVYEVKLMNRGAIDAPFTYIPSATTVGRCFKFAPEEGVIAAGGIQTIHISFNATVLGSFEEQFQFRVAASPTPVILTVCCLWDIPHLPHFGVEQRKKEFPELFISALILALPQCRVPGGWNDSSLQGSPSALGHGRQWDGSALGSSCSGLSQLNTQQSSQGFGDGAAWVILQQQQCF